MSRKIIVEQPRTTEAFRTRILDHIITHRNRYPKSAESRICCETIWEPYGKTGPMTDNREQIEAFHEAIRKLEQEGLLTAIWNPNTGVFTRLCVTKAQATAIFQMKKVLPQEMFYNTLAQRLVREMEGSSCTPIANLIKDQAVQFVRDNANYGQGAEEDLNTGMDTLHTICRIVTAVWENKEDILERNLSVRLNLGSKGFSAHYKQRVARILSTAAGADDGSANDILKEYHVLQNPPSVGVRGNAVIQMKNGDKLTLSQYNGAIYLEEDFVQQIDRVTTCNLFSIENLTTFHSLPAEINGLAVFTSGYPCLLVTHFMEKAVRDNCLRTVFHWGDIDAYGFKILYDIRSKLSARVQALHMGVEDYLDHKEHAISMTEKNRRELAKFLQDPSCANDEKTLFQLLLADGVTLEQESLWTGTTK